MRAFVEDALAGRLAAIIYVGLVAKVGLVLAFIVARRLKDLLW